jgi:hypothetical protein
MQTWQQKYVSKARTTHIGSCTNVETTVHKPDTCRA